jgi:hypothetical protein
MIWRTRRAVFWRRFAALKRLEFALLWMRMVEPSRRYFAGLYLRMRKEGLAPLRLQGWT